MTVLENIMHTLKINLNFQISDKIQNLKFKKSSKKFLLYKN